MTSIKANLKDKLCIFISGHAGFAKKGQDIVCSAVSILALTLESVVLDFYEASKLRAMPDIKLKNGKASIICEPKKESFNEVLKAYLVVLKGFELLNENYNEYISLKITR